MRNAVIAAAVAIAALTAGALWFIFDATQVGPRRRPGETMAAKTRPVAVEDGEAAPAGEGPAPGPASATPAAGAAPIPATAPTGPPAPIPLQPWSQVRTARLNAMRGPERDAVIFGMQNLRDDLAACFREANQPRDGVKVQAAEGAWDEADEGRTVLQLSLEARRGEVVIENVAVLVRGGADDGLVTCFQRLLQGHSFPAQEARPGWRQKVRLPVAR